MSDIYYYLRQYRAELRRPGGFEIGSRSPEERLAIKRWAIDYLTEEIFRNPKRNVYELIEELVCKFEEYATWNVENSYIFSEAADIYKDVYDRLSNWDGYYQGGIF